MKLTAPIKSRLQIIAQALPPLYSTPVPVTTVTYEHKGYGFEHQKTTSIHEYQVNHYDNLKNAYKKHGLSGVEDYKQIVLNRRLKNKNDSRRELSKPITRFDKTIREEAIKLGIVNT